MRQFVLTNLVETDEGAFRWRLNLDVIRADFHKVTTWPFSGSTEVKTLLVSGKSSNYVKHEHLQAMHRHFPNTTHVALEAGHWVHAERPREFVDRVAEFLIRP